MATPFHSGGGLKYCRTPLVSRSTLLRLGPPLIVEIGWWLWALLDPKQNLGRFAKPTPFIGYYYYMSLTMVLGSLVAGATSEGGGAIAFPVMTLALGVPPHLARDFSFAIQSFGMTCASITIVGLRLPLDLSALLWCSVGGSIGLVVGLVAVAPHLPPAYAKMLFVCAWIAFAVALFRLNATDWDRKVYKSSAESDRSLKMTTRASVSSNGTELSYGDVSVEDAANTDNRGSGWCSKLASSREQRKRAAIFAATGLFGGLCSSVAGSGLDMASFSVATLYFRVSEKVATPTSVLLMAANAIMGMACRSFGLGGKYGPGEEEVVWNFVSVCIPIVVIGAPLGATISAKLSRNVISGLIYVLDTVQFVAALAIIQPWSKPYPHNLGLCLSSAATLLIGSAFFYKLADWGEEREIADPRSLDSDDVVEGNGKKIGKEEISTCTSTV